MSQYREESPTTDRSRQTDLRRRAERLVEEGRGPKPPPSSADIFTLIHELTVYQSELEMQNEELRAAQNALELSRRHFIELFAVSPVAYLEVAESGVIVDANRAAGQLLGLDIAVLRGRPLSLSIQARSHAEMLEQRRCALRGDPVPVIQLSIQRRDRSACESHARVVALSSREPATLLYALVDVTEQEEATARLREVAHELELANLRLHELAMHDHHTGLLNRRGLEQTMSVEIERARRSGAPMSCILMDCDNFKTVNDSMGYAAGDVVLSTLARRLLGSLRPSDHLARIGGDEFLALLPDTTLEQAHHVADRLRLAVASEPVALSHEPVKMSISVAVASATLHEITIEELLLSTRWAIKRSKLRGKNRVTVAVGDGHEAPATRLERDRFPELIRTQDFFEAWVHPIVSLVDEQPVGYEFLTRGTVQAFHLPVDFFRLAVEDGLLTMVDLACIRTCIEASRKVAPSLWCHVNLYPSTLIELPTDRLGELFQAPIGRTHLCLELSEQQMLGDPRCMLEHIHRLRELGVHIAIDDVGFGRTSLENLIVLEPAMIKIDRSNVTDVSKLRSKARALERLVTAGHALKTIIVAEGIETAEDLAVLRDLGVHYGQGFLWGKPVPWHESFLGGRAT